MEYAEALKKVTAEKTKDNYLIVKFNYDYVLVLPYKEGMAFVASLNNAELLSEGYSEQHRIKEFDRNTIEMRVLSNKEYTRIKIAALLGVSPDSIKEAQENPQPT